MVSFNFFQPVKYSDSPVYTQDLVVIRLLASIMLELLHEFLYILVITVGILLSSTQGK
jgi:hypothetical protein